MDKINEERIKQLLVKHLMNDLDSSEAREIDEWRKQSPSNDSLFLRMSDSSYLAKRYRDFAQVALLVVGRPGSGCGSRHPAFCDSLCHEA